MSKNETVPVITLVLAAVVLVAMLMMNAAQSRKMSEMRLEIRQLHFGMDSVTKNLQFRKTQLAAKPLGIVP